MASKTIDLTSSAIGSLTNISSAASTSGSYYQTGSVDRNGGTLFIRIPINLRTAIGYSPSYVTSIDFKYSIAQQRTAGAKGQIQTGYKNSSGGDTLTSSTREAGQGSGFNQYGVYSTYTDNIDNFYVTSDTVTLVMKITNPIALNACAYRIRSVSFDINYTVPTYTITANASPAEGGTVSGGGSYTSGSTANLTATANTGYEFTGWSDGVKDNPRNVTVTGNATYTAQFKKLNYTVAWVDGDGNTIKTDTVEYGATPSYSGATPTKAQTTQYTYEFSGWSPTIGAITANTTYTAQFTAKLREYAVNVFLPNEIEGTIEGVETRYYPYGTQLEIKATANHGYEPNFIRVVLPDDLEDMGDMSPYYKDYYPDESSDTFSITLTVLGSFGVAAFFKEKDKGTIILSVEEAENGVVTGLNVGENRILVGETVTLTVTPNEGYKPIIRVPASEDIVIDKEPEDYLSPFTFTVVGKGVQEIQVLYVKDIIRNIQLGTLFVNALAYDEQTKTVYFIVDEYVEIEPTGADTVDGLNFAVSTIDNLPENVKFATGAQLGTKYIFQN